MPRKPRDCRHELSYPLHETVVFCLSAPDWVAHRNNRFCKIEEPHRIDNCTAFKPPRPRFMKKVRPPKQEKIKAPPKEKVVRSKYRFKSTSMIELRVKKHDETPTPIESVGRSVTRTRQGDVQWLERSFGHGT